MANQVEGDWNGFTFKMVDTADYPEILKLVNENFHIDEPAHSMCSADAEYFAYANTRIVTRMNRSRHLCFLAWDRASGQLAGAQLQVEFTREEALNPPQNITHSTPIRKILSNVFPQLDKSKIGLFARFNAETIVNNFLACTSRNFRQQGLATEMYRRMVLLLQAQGFPAVYSLFTSPFTRRCAEKSGFVEVDRVLFKDMRDTEGNQVLPNANEHDCMSLMVLEL